MSGAEAQPTAPEPADPEAARKGALSKAMNMLGRRDYSCQELADRLADRFPEDAIQAAIDKLTEYGYLNDQRLAERLIDDAVNRRHHGPRRIRHDLIRRKIPAAAYQDALERYSDRDIVEAAARAAAIAFFKGRPPTADAVSCRRLAGFLGRRGFADGTIHAMLHLVRQGALDDHSDTP